MNFVSIPGNVRNSYFHNTSLSPEDIPHFAKTMMMLVLVDALSLVISLIFLKMRCKINLFHIYLHQQQHFGLVLAIQTAFIMESWFAFLPLGTGTDMTNNFNWLKSGYVLADEDEDWRFSQSVNLTYLLVD